MRTSLTIILVTSGLAALIVLLATIPMAYAGGYDINRNKAKDSSQAGIADCDHNYVKYAGFKCVPIAIGEVEPPTTILEVCKESIDPALFTFTVTGNSPSPSQFVLGDGTCMAVTIGPGIYRVQENPILGQTIRITGDCIPDGLPPFNIANGLIQSGETQNCTFQNGEIPQP